MKFNRWACLICFLCTPHTVNSLVGFFLLFLKICMWGEGLGGGFIFVCMTKWVKLL